MKVKEIIEQLNRIKSNNYDEGIIRKFIEDCDHIIYRDIISLSLPNKDESIPDERERYPFGSSDVELLAREENSSIYLYYAMAMIDLYNAETERYTNNMIMYNNAFNDLSAWYTRTHKSKLPNHLRTEVI